MKIKNLQTLDWAARWKAAREKAEKRPTLGSPKYDLEQLPFLFDLDDDQHKTLAIVLKTINKLKK